MLQNPFLQPWSVGIYHEDLAGSLSPHYPCVERLAQFAGTAVAIAL